MAISGDLQGGPASDQENEEHTPPPLPREHHVEDNNNNDVESQTSGSVTLAASSPLTDCEGECEAQTKPHRGDKAEADAATAATTMYLRDVLQSIDLVRRGRHPVLTRHCDRLEFPLPPPEFHLFGQFLEGDTGALRQIDADLDLDLDLEMLWRWSHDRLIWDYDSHLSLLIVRTPTPLHLWARQDVQDLLKARFLAALEASGRRGGVESLPNVGYVFRAPQDRPVAPPSKDEEADPQPRSSITRKPRRSKRQAR